MNGDVGSAPASIDEIQITVHYTPASSATVSMYGGLSRNVTSYEACNGDNILRDIGQDAPSSFYVTFAWNGAVTNFTIDDLSVTTSNATLSNFQTHSTSVYSVQVTPTSNNVTITLRVATNAVSENNAQTDHNFYFNSNDYSFCCISIDPTNAVFFSLDEQSGTTADDQPIVIGDAAYDATLMNMDTPSVWDQCQATTSTVNVGSLLFDGVNDYVLRDTSHPLTHSSTFYASLYFRRATSQITSTETLLHITYDNGSTANSLLAIQLNPDIENFLHISRRLSDSPESVKISDTPMNLLDWNHLVVKVTGGVTNAITEVYLNGEDVMADGSNAQLGHASNKVILGAAYDGSYGSYFKGTLDEVMIIKDRLPNETSISTFSGIADAMIKTDCAATSSYHITALPSGSHTARLARMPTVNPVTGGTGQAGTVKVRLRENGVSLMEADVAFTQNRSWSNVSTFTNVTDLGNVPVTPKCAIDISGANTGLGATHALLCPKGITTSFRLCPSASDLSGVSGNCSGGVVFTEGQTQMVGEDTVTVTTVTIGGVNYWKADGVSGTGGQGEGGGAVPEFGYIPFIALIVGCAWYLKRQVLA